MKKLLTPNASDSWKKHSSKVYMCSFAALICAVYALFLANKSFSPAEGWYSYYAYLINEEGAVPYLDFELLFPPLYTYIIALFTKIFGYNIMALRIFGALIYSATGVFACLIFDKLTHSKFIGLLCGILTVSVLQSEIVQIFYDYIRVMDLFVYASIYFFLCYLDKLNEDESNKLINANLITGTIFAVLASMCKQSSGLFYLLFCFIFMLFLLICIKKFRKILAGHIGIMAAITAIMYGIMVAFLASKGALTAYIKYNFASSIDAKGGGNIFKILFGWIGRSGSQLLNGLLFTLCAVALIAVFVLLTKKFPSQDKIKVNEKFLTAFRICIPVLLLLGVILPITVKSYAESISKVNGSMVKYMCFIFATLLFALLAFHLIFQKKFKIDNLGKHIKYMFLSGVIFLLAFSVCTSGGLAESQIALGYAFIIVILLAFAGFRKKEIAVSVLCAAMLLQTTIAFGIKTNHVYSWWGLSTGNAFEQTEECDIPILQGIKMNSDYAKMYNNVYKGVTENTKAGDEIFVFPHMPVLYLATDRPRATGTAIQWFDVSTDSAVVDDIEVIKEKRPKILVLCSVDKSVIDAHETNFRNGEISGLHAMQDFLNQFVIDENYECLSSDNISSGYTVTVWLLP